MWTEHYNPDLQDYVYKFLSEAVHNNFSSFQEWSSIEHIVSRLYFGFTSFFTPSDYSEVPRKHESDLSIPIPLTPRPDCVTSVRYMAVNFRGLYQRNGRDTIVAAYGKLRKTQPDVTRHQLLHDIYLSALARKTESINQLFVATTNLTNLSIAFDSDVSSVTSEEDGQVHIKIGKDVSVLWNDPDVIESWDTTISYGIEASTLDEESPDRFFSWLTHSREAVLRNVQKKGRLLLGTGFFREWSEMPHEPPLGNAIETAERFQQWLLSLCWLAFYCRPTHAGSYFYTLRLPRLLQNDTDLPLPDSSVSLVASEAFSEKCAATWGWFPEYLLMGQELFSIFGPGGHVQRAFSRFKKRRSQDDLVGEEGPLARFISHDSMHKPKINGQIVSFRKPTAPSTLSVDYKKLAFLLRMARLLIAQKHEGHQLHFCFIFGFSWERIDSESKGWLIDVVGQLRDQWDAFEKKIIRKSIERQVRVWSPELHRGAAKPIVLGILAEGMAKWIKTGDLPLQPWDAALFFEDVEEKDWPLPVSIVRVSSSPDGNQQVSTEFQLRRSLKKLTSENSTAIAILSAESGLILYARGKGILLPSHSGVTYDSPFVGIRLWGGLVDEDKFLNFLETLLGRGPFSRIPLGTRKKASRIVVDLCEALVTLCHGALIVLRTGENQDPLLSPLNPVWHVMPDKNGPDLEKDILLYALMAALDGASEIYLSPCDRPISFTFRKSVLPKADIWAYDEEGYEELSNSFTHSGIDALSLVGKGTRHHSALALSLEHQDAIVLTISADGPVTLWQAGKKLAPEEDPQFQPRFRP